eukprot:m.237264 g.237264  ORF g.237264 m.237264 type:complete len:95 (+) comp33704_c0_seq1:3518-3802(+)
MVLIVIGLDTNVYGPSQHVGASVTRGTNTGATLCARAVLTHGMRCWRSLSSPSKHYVKMMIMLNDDDDVNDHDHDGDHTHLHTSLYRSTHAHNH